MCGLSSVIIQGDGEGTLGVPLGSVRHGTERLAGDRFRYAPGLDPEGSESELRMSERRFARRQWALALLGSLGAVTAMAASNDEVGRMAPPLVVRALDGKTVDLAALRGQVVVLNVWASWCTPCRAEMPMLDSFYREHAKEGVVVLGMSADDPHDRSAVSHAMQGLTYPAALLVDAKPNGFGDPSVLPTTYIIDRSGVIRARLLPTRGALTAQSLGAVVTPLLGR